MNNIEVARSLEDFNLSANAGEKEVAKAFGRFSLDIYRVEKSGKWNLKDQQSFTNLLTNAGAAILEDLLIGAGGTVFSNANAYIGVGDSSTAVSASHTDLQAASNKLRVAMDATFPSRSSQTLTFKSTFSTSQANWTWNEMAAFNASSSGTMLNRALVASPFTKTSALAVVATLTWTVA